ncbi:MAG: beta-lactamase family protein [Acidimicrobiales bacterium]|nr:beta-lactamase family protein [Acidimicrobiales bacterium]MCB9394743.1 beta-lactamase family protein [Acidimicrobiaceae bacterium]
MIATTVETSTEGPATTLVEPETTAEPTTTAEPGTTSTPIPPGGYPSAIVATVVDDGRFDPLEQRITTALADAGLPGASLLVVQHGEIVEQEAWGDYSLDTRVPIASGSKWLTAATIMTLVDDGLLALDEPIATYVPQLAGFTVGTITMRQLLSFTSGLVGDNGAPACVTSGEGTLQECAAEILRTGAVRQPGSAFVYGSQHMHVAGAIAEIVTGETFFDLFDQRIAKPLGMDRTVFFQLRDPTATTVDHPMPAGGAASTLGDYARFLEMLVHDGVAPDGTRVLSEDAVAVMQTDQIAGAEYAAAAPYRMTLRTPYGLGEWLDGVDADGRGIVVSSDGKFGFRPWIDHANDLFGVYLVDDRGSGYVEGDPDGRDAARPNTSGLWVFEMTADALSG